MNNLVVVGGGTAGWITALQAKQNFTNAKVTLIQSEELGILGAGEAATPHILAILRYLNISIVELIKETNATIKNAIKFTNWDQDKFYFHGFFEPSNINENNCNNFINDFFEPPIDFAFPYGKLNNIDLHKLFCSHSFSNNCITPFYKENTNDANKIFNTFMNYSIHFDANLLAKYLEKIGNKRGIEVINDKVLNFKQDSKGYIQQIVLENHPNVDANFVFDATGFNRLIIGKFYKSKWISYKDYLPVKKAMPFILPITEDKLESYTEATAMDYGWMWKIPLQTRYGCGYVYDSNYITDEQAKEEIFRHTGQQTEINKIFTFEAGIYKDIWIKNCLAVGLAAGFIEPLESTSIMQTIRILQRFMCNRTHITNKNKKIIDDFNEKIVNDSDEIMSFIYMHYVTNKTNTEFWSKFTKNNKIPDTVKEIIKEIKYHIPSFYDFRTQKTFGYSNYMTIIFGNNLVDKKVLKQYECFQSKKEYMDRRISEIEMIQYVLMDHKEFISKIKELT